MGKTKFTENDLELIYRIRGHDDVAMDAMIEKYRPLIYKKIILFRFPENEKVDYFQEGLMVLDKAINTYREDNEQKKTFTRYFELLLCNRFTSLYRANKSKNQYLLLNDEEINALADESDINYNAYLDVNTESLSHFEKEIFDYYYINNLSVSEICDELNIDNKKVYNALNRIRKKLK